MGRKWLVALCAGLVVLPVIMTGCSRDDVAIVRIQLQNMPKGTAQSSNSIVSRIFRWFVTEAYASWDYPNTALRVVVTAPDLETVTFNAPYEQQSTVTIEIPSGPRRRITVYGYYDYTEVIDKTWGGHAEVDLNPGEEKDVEINMLPIVMADAFFDQFNSLVTVYWNAISENPMNPLFGVTGYRVYRSDAGAEGPFNPIGVSEGINSYEFNDDASVGFTVGTTYHYAVSVYTNTSEGELSDPFEYVVLNID